ncbi:hypothetical protein BGZ82_002428 [Podila clonocystis]|nr:hypothetical protein BGZ82_002428 [Podila clonocystis]
MSTRLGNALLVGIVLGQIVFGFFVDRVGRKVGIMVTTFLIILSAALCAGAYGAGGSVKGLFWALTMYRGILGVGVGGEYLALPPMLPSLLTTSSTVAIYKELISTVPLFVVLYGVILSLGRFGPGDMVIVSSSEIFPTAIRGTAYCWSAAIEKLSAVCGISAFKPAMQHVDNGDTVLGQSRVFILASRFALFAAIVAYALIPNYFKQDLSIEDEEFNPRLLEIGYDISRHGSVPTTKGLN